MNKTTNSENINIFSKNVMNQFKKKYNIFEKESKKISKKESKKISKKFQKKNTSIITKSINNFNNIENVANENENIVKNSNKNKSSNNIEKIVYNNNNKQTSQLEILFDLVLNKFEQLSKKYLNLDGKALWQPIKKILSKYDEPHFHALKYKTLSNSLIDKIMSITEYIRNGRGEETLIVQNHFIIQQVRIPLKEEPSIKNIIQIALNIGQWKGNPDKKIYNLLNYKKSGLDKINKYLNNYNINKLSSYIDNNTVISIKEYLDSL
jgi:hypothetical protein